MEDLLNNKYTAEDVNKNINGLDHPAVVIGNGLNEEAKIFTGVEVFVLKEGKNFSNCFKNANIHN